MAAQPSDAGAAGELAGRLQELATRHVECCVADFSSNARGKIVTRADFLALGGCRLASVALGLTLTGENATGAFGRVLPASFADIDLVADAATLVEAPDRPGVASVLCEPSGTLLAEETGLRYDASALSPRAALRRTLARLAQAGLSARAAPEMEFYLFARRPGGAAHELQAPRPAPGSPAWESACEADSIERAACFGAYFDELFAACERWSIPVTGYSHESALSQYEVNFTPGEPLAQADAVFRFKRLARHVAARHGFLASFLAKPFLDQPGAGTHWHFSLQDHQGNNAFLAADGQSEAPALDAFMAGVQAHAPAAMAFLAPYDNSYDRLHHADSSPSRATCGRDDRNAAFRVPRSSPANRRVENRLPGGDASPYLTAALTLGLGLEGMNRGGQPVPAPGIALPRTLSEALDALDGDRVVRQLLGDPLVELYLAIKRTESAQRMRCKHPREDWDLLVLPEQA